VVHEKKIFKIAKMSPIVASNWTPFPKDTYPIWSKSVQWFWRCRLKETFSDRRAVRQIMFVIKHRYAINMENKEMYIRLNF